jgi:effector-binding domain-containing protein
VSTATHRLRRAELERTVADEQSRLRRVEAHLRAIEGSNIVKPLDVVIKETKPLRLAEAREVAAGLDPEHIARAFIKLAPRLIDHFQQAGAQPGTLVHYYDEPADDGSVGVHVGYEIGEQPVPAGDGVEIVDLPVVRVASIVHRGGMEGIVPVYEALIGWIEDNGYRAAGYSRELYHEVGADGPRVTELQMPIAK